jgi:hypothetical protein
MLRNMTLTALALLLATAAAHAGLVASVEKRVNPGTNAFPYIGFPSSTFTTDTELNTNPTLQNTWVSYALGLTPSGGEKITSLTVSITSTVDATHGILQRFNYNADTDSYDPSPSSANVTNGDSHLIVFGSSPVIVTAPSETFQASGGPPKPADVAGTRQYGYSGTMSGL